ncbi:MAG TPA: glycosyltransferase family 1 protein [Rhizomicrobium sp.]|nr:glycosyltransferase family 1 protein [Rhizomicrobium sp.]
MIRLGLFLGVKPHAGGMFQYAQSLLDALAALPPDRYGVEVACASEDWRPILATYPFPVTWLKHGELGLRMADGLMALLVPGPLSRLLSRLFNPVVRQIMHRRQDFWIFPAQDGIAYQTPVPMVVAIHDLMHRYERRFPEVGGGYRFPIREHRFRSLVRWAKGVLVDSEIGRRQVVDAYGVDTGKVYPLPYIPPREIYAAGAADLSQYDLPKKFLFYPAQFWAHKNHQALLEAGAALLPRCPDLQFAFTGGKRNLYDQLVAHAERLGMRDHVRFLGYVGAAELPTLYRRARALVMPTFLGPTNIPPLEAMACGCPVAVSGIYAMPEQLGDAALYFDPLSTAAMAAVIEQLWRDDDLCRRLSQAGLQHVAAWGPAQFANRLQEILDSLTA